ncbi:putative (S)-norcoclaurine synthase [Dioscorea sansibarensis]
MNGGVSYELEVALQAKKIWAVYRALRLAELMVELLPNLIEKFDIVQVDGIPIAGISKEKFTKIDDVKEVHTTEGGYLQLGFNSFMVRLEIIAKVEAVLVLRSIMEYEIDDEFADKASLVSTATMATICETTGKYPVEQESKTCFLSEKSQ